ncbi:flap endonuclease Xni [bacterium]|nr:flap endonuclease Xni [bacterium]
MGLCVLLIDALNLIRRVDAARRDTFGQKTGGSCVEACVQSLRRALKECGPTHAVSVFEGQGPSFRTVIYPEYKAGREPMPQDLAESLPSIRAAFLESGVVSIEKDSMEADDIIATLTRRAESGQGRVIILSTDKIFLQLLSGNVSVRDHFGKRFLDEPHVLEKFHVLPHQLVDLLAMAGDPTNNIPGIPGVGMKTAARLLQEFRSLEHILSQAPAMGTKLGMALVKSEERARMFQGLLRLRTDIEMGMNLRAFRYRD